MRVLVVEDSEALAAQLREALAAAHFAVDHAADGEEALFLGETEPYDAVVLDLGLPRLDGLSVLRRWRAAGRAMPVLILTARDAWTEKVAGLDAGADDYLAKPFVMGELLARLRALVRRAHGRAQAELQVGALSIDTATSAVALEGRPVRLTGLEFRLLSYLAHRPGQVVSKTELTEHLYAQDFDRDSNTLEVVIGRLRRKLDPALIETLRGQGYRLVAPG
ncbi:response regulator transcription factor [Siccirubricoccus sp. KC 17139]|uniref:Response regulator transcription factor n=1 Tax=Siccirubricoccus soli TaxID=2899147 RepID=A0ABT1D5M1_9PROT|nr:response regulator transcription factor [Siccirubricoccus soli]MCO6417219.1 response regulator transcription factor [Siccirubricoccus soli]MCP2683354.1 response regulator transcription factor [Siccirubricoccus soli]